MNDDVNFDEMRPLSASTSLTPKKKIKRNICIYLAIISIIILIIGILIIVISLFSLQTNKLIQVLIEVLSTFTRSEMCVNMDQLVKNLNNKTLPQFNNNSI